MTDKTRDFIRNTASCYRDLFELEPPVNSCELVSMIAELKGDIIGVPSLEDEFVIKKTGKQSFSLFIPEDLGMQDDAYKLATILGYLFIVMGFHTDANLWENSATLHEQDGDAFSHLLMAQEFADELLMPYGEFEEAVEENEKDGKIPIVEIAEWFGLPVGVVMARGKKLGFW